MTRQVNGKSKDGFYIIGDQIRKCKACQNKKWGLCKAHKPLMVFLQ